jgi:type III pantothenate kinase
MLLAIDCGNTNIVFALFEGDALKGEWRSSTHLDRTADDLGVWLLQVMGLNGLDRSAVDGSIIASVVPSLDFTLKSMCRRYFDRDPMIVGAAGVDIGIGVKMDNPEEVGADRLVDAVAAHARYGGPLIVIDFGTATTFNVIDADGNFCGGALAPGANLSMEALHMAAAKLPRIAIAKPLGGLAIGKSTLAAMRSGIYWGYVAMIEGMVARIESEFGSKMTVVATGGLSPLFIEATDRIQHLDTGLTMRGLRLIYERNNK